MARSVVGRWSLSLVVRSWYDCARPEHTETAYEKQPDSPRRRHRHGRDHAAGQERAGLLGRHGRRPLGRALGNTLRHRRFPVCDRRRGAGFRAARLYGRQGGAAHGALCPVRGGRRRRGAARQRAQPRRARPIARGRQHRHLARRHRQCRGADPELYGQGPPARRCLLPADLYLQHGRLPGGDRLRSARADHCAGAGLRHRHLCDRRGRAHHPSRRRCGGAVRRHRRRRDGAERHGLRRDRRDRAARR